MMASPLGHCFHSHVVQFSQGHLKTSFPITIINYAVYVFQHIEYSSTLKMRRRSALDLSVERQLDELWSP